MRVTFGDTDEHARDATPSWIARKGGDRNLWRSTLFLSKLTSLEHQRCLGGDGSGGCGDRGIKTKKKRKRKSYDSVDAVENAYRLQSNQIEKIG